MMVKVVVVVEQHSSFVSSINLRLFIVIVWNGMSHFDQESVFNFSFSQNE